jgi:hypothetical protein
MSYIKEIDDLEYASLQPKQENSYDETTEKFETFFDSLKKVASSYGREEVLVIMRSKQEILDNWLYLFS